MGFTNSLLNPVLQPLFKLGAFFGVLIVSIVVSVLVSLVYKFFTNQQRMGELKSKLKEHQQEIKVSKEDPPKVMGLQKEMMHINLEYMKLSFKPMLITFIPIILIFGWLNAHVAFEPINPLDEVSVSVDLAMDVNASLTSVSPSGLTILNEPGPGLVKTFRFKADKPGSYILDFSVSGQSYTKELLVTNEFNYVNPVKEVDDGLVNKIVVGQQKLRPLGDFSIFGWKPGWLGLYIVLSLVFSLVFRKFLKLN